LKASPLPLLLLGLCAAVFSGCATYDRRGLAPEQARALEAQPGAAAFRPPVELKQRILALNAERVTETDVRETLASAPAPRVINIHGGIAPVQYRMISFAHFLLAMGYPSNSLANPNDGTFTFSCYEDADMLAGMIAWYYERDGLRPVIVGHSQGGMQAIKVLYRFAGKSRLAVWNPLTWRREDRYKIIDPLTGQWRPVVGLKLPYVSAVGSGGPTRLLPSQWEMNGKLRAIPDTVEEFTGFCKGLDLLGGEFLGYGPANEYHAKGTARVRNVWLPSAYEHGKVPDTAHLAEHADVRAWINNYHPPNQPVNTPKLDATFDSNTENILWAADVWYSIKKHWVLELQRLCKSKVEN
jgi:pimeloyl-ACP methyl ester carboxylesterase